MGGDREKEMRERRKERVAEELESVGVYLKGYKRMNDTVCGFACPRLEPHLIWVYLRCRSSPCPHSRISRRRYLQAAPPLLSGRSPGLLPPLDPALLNIYNDKRSTSSLLHRTKSHTRPLPTMLLVRVPVGRMQGQARTFKGSVIMKEEYVTESTMYHPGCTIGVVLLVSIIHTAFAMLR